MAAGSGYLFGVILGAVLYQVSIIVANSADSCNHTLLHLRGGVQGKLPPQMAQLPPQMLN